MNYIEKMENFKKLMPLFVIVQEMDFGLNEYIEEYGNENVFKFENISFHFKVDSPVFIKIESYNSKNQINKDTKVVLLYSDITLINIAESDILNVLKHTTFNCNPYKNRQGQTVNEIGSDCIYFINCIFNVLSKPELIGTSKFKSVYYKDCKINRLNIVTTNSTDFNYKLFQNCSFDYVVQKHSELKFTFENNRIDILKMSSSTVDLINVNLKLVYHHNIEEVKINADNVKIIFDRKLLKKLDPNEYFGTMNTFSYIIGLNSFQNSKFIIEKYIHFFKSRSDFFAKLLYWFNGGYTKIVIPFITTAVLFLLNFLILYFYLGEQKYSVYYLVFPVDLFKKVIFSEINLKNVFSFAKIFLSIFELLFIYALFSLTLSFKKIYGFKI